MPTRRALSGGGLVTLWERWLRADEAARLFSSLQIDVAWKQETIRIAGREILQPRLSAWYGDDGASYTYSGLTLEPLPFPGVLDELRKRIEVETGARFNSVLLNAYRDGRDSMGIHADREPELGRNPTIASLSLGATRRFVLKREKIPKDASPSRIAPVELALEHGSLLLMSGTTQHHWKHFVPKEPEVTASRINLTFRLVARDRRLDVG